MTEHTQGAPLTTQGASMNRRFAIIAGAVVLVLAVAVLVILVTSRGDSVPSLLTEYSYTLGGSIAVNIPLDWYAEAESTENVRVYSWQYTGDYVDLRAGLPEGQMAMDIITGQPDIPADPRQLAEETRDMMVPMLAEDGDVELTIDPHIVDIGDGSALVFGAIDAADPLIEQLMVYYFADENTVFNVTAMSNPGDISDYRETIYAILDTVVYVP